MNAEKIKKDIEVGDGWDTFVFLLFLIILIPGLFCWFGYSYTNPESAMDILLKLVGE